MATQPLGRSKVDPPIPYDFVKANKEYCEDFHNPEPSDLTRGPRTYTVIVACVDGRADPEHCFHLKPNEAWSIRNGGGRTNDGGVLRTLTILQALSEVREVKVVHHKNCGSLYFTNRWVQEMVTKNVPAPSGQFGPAALAYAQTIPTLPFSRTGDETDEKEIVLNSIRHDVEFLRGHPLVKETVKITGWYQDLHDGSVHEVEI